MELGVDDYQDKYYGYPEYKQMLCEFDQMQTLPKEPCFEYTKLLNTSDIFQYLDGSLRPMIEISSDLSLIGDIFSANRSSLRAYGSFKMDIDHTALEVEALNRTTKFFQGLDMDPTVKSWKEIPCLAQQFDKSNSKKERLDEISEDFENIAVAYQKFMKYPENFEIEKSDIEQFYDEYFGAYNERNKLLNEQYKFKRLELEQYKNPSATQ